MRKKRGSPLLTSGLPLRIPIAPRDKERLVELAEQRGTSLAELVREAVVAACASPTPDVVLEEPTSISVRLDDELLLAIDSAAASGGLEAASWLRLLLSLAGERLADQIRAARKRLG